MGLAGVVVRGALPGEAHVHRAAGLVAGAAGVGAMPGAMHGRAVGLAGAVGVGPLVLQRVRGGWWYDSGCHCWR